MADVILWEGNEIKSINKIMNNKKNTFYYEAKNKETGDMITPFSFVKYCSVFFKFIKRQVFPNSTFLL